MGVDCATQAKRVGLALGHYEDGAACIEQVLVGSMVDSIGQTVADWTRRTSSTLIALDAPLGWPADLGRTLHEHEAGAPIEPEANRIFRRRTDREVKQTVGKQPLDVGADRIARTAYAALKFLHRLRAHTGEVIPLAWDPRIGAGVHAIEVYPGATLAAYRIESSGYKREEGHAPRQAILRFLQTHMHLPEDLSLMELNDDALDAALCVLAGVDFLRGEVFKPTDVMLARKEGWIWVRKPINRADHR
jgi:predicted RNase H-like nuclease